MLVVGGFLLAGAAWAAELEDGSGSAGRYTNLTAETGSSRIGWSDPPDGSYLSQNTNRNTAQAVYEIWDTSSVTVTLYSRYASFATEDSDGQWFRGYAGGVGGEERLQYSPKNGEVYLDDARMVYDADSGIFSFEPDSAPSGLVDYGLNVYWSQDGKSYQKADCRLVDAAAEDGAHYFETYEAGVDWEACYLKLVLYDQSSVEVLGRAGRYEFAQKGGLAIASVEIDGQAHAPALASSSKNASANADDLLADTGFEETIIETAPKGQNITPAFPEEEAEEIEDALTPLSAKSSAGGKSTGAKAGPGEVIQGGGVLSEHVYEVIRPASLSYAESTFWDRLCTPEGVAICFFSLACILLALKMLVKDKKEY